MSIPRPSTSRRTAIALALSAPLALAACDLDPPSASPSSLTETAAPPPDADVVAAAGKSIMLAVALLEAVRARHRPLREDIRPLLALHRAHLEVLERTSDESVEAVLVAETPALALAQISNAEVSLAFRLADAARQAASGDLARALASMSAAVNQRLTT